MSSMRAATCAGAQGTGRSLYGRGPAQPEADPLALAHREGRVHRRVLDEGRDAGGDGDLVGAAEGAPAVVLHAEQRPHQPVLGPRRELHLQLDAARHALDEAQHLVRRVAPEVVAALPGGEGHRVDQAHAAGRGGEGGLDDERARQVAALRGARPGRGDRPVPGVGIEDAGEDGRRVVVGHAQPVDRPVAVDQRGRRAVGQQAVGGDGLKAGRAALGDGGGGLGEDAHGAPVSPRGVELRVTARTTPVTAQRHGAHLHEPAHRRRDRLRRPARRSASSRPCASRRW